MSHRDHPTSHIPILGTPWGSPGLEALGQAHQGEEQEQLHGGSSRKMCLQSQLRSLYPRSGVWPEAPIRKANCSWDGYQNVLKEGGGGMSSWGIPEFLGGFRPQVCWDGWEALLVIVWEAENTGLFVP